MEPSTPSVPEVLGYAEAAERLGVTETWLRNKVRRRAVPHVKYGRYIKFTEDDLAEIIESGRRSPEVVKPATPVDETTAPAKRQTRRRAS